MSDGSDFDPVDGGLVSLACGYVRRLKIFFTLKRGLRLSRIDLTDSLSPWSSSKAGDNGREVVCVG